jgi:hypothetical protein
MNIYRTKVKFELQKNRYENFTGYPTRQIKLGRRRPK